MIDKMNALAVTVLGEKAELMEMPRPRAGQGEIIIKTWHSGVSVGTEMWIASGKRNDYGDPPFINGYQATGEIIEVGADVEELSVGDAVVTFCNGAHAEYVKGIGAFTHKIDASLARSAALFVMPSVGANALNHANVNSGDTVLVVGQGLIGQSTAMLARLRGAYVITSDVSPERLEISRNHCADWAIDAGQGRVSDAVKTRFPGGLDVVLESTGLQVLLDDALECCSNNGRFVFEGWYPGNVNYNFSIPHTKQLRAFYPCFIGPRASQQGVLRLLAGGHLDMTPLISHTPKWSECAELYNQLFTKERDHFNGIVVDWTV